MVGEVYGGAVIRRSLLCTCACLVLLAACGDEDKGASSCDPRRAHPIDPASSQHILPGAPEPTFTTNPPTSGAHAPGAHPTGVLTSEIAKPVQVAMLESGQVLLQYGSISAAQRQILERFASSNELVTVAPNESLSSPIVATAWLHSMDCERADQTAIEKFIDDHAGKGPGH